MDRVIAWLRALSKQSWMFFLGFVLLLSYFTHFHGYWDPPHLFWDENYHISAAQKELHGIFYMEPHPPLGKLFIAAGEWLLSPNEETNQFIDTDYGKNLPAGFSFAGYRLFPALLSWLTAGLVFGIFLLITRNPLFATLLSFFYVFDNAIIVHSRGAMLEPPIHFFSLSMVLLFLACVQQRLNTRTFRICAALFGAAFGALMTTKVNGLVMILLIPFLLWALWPDKRRIGEFLGIQTLAFLLVFVAVWHVHFANGATVNPSLPDQGYYQASQQYKEILSKGTNDSLLHFPIMLRDSLAFLPHYEQGVPKLDLCKNDENGSPFFFWPFGARTIQYRWQATTGSDAYQYLYLVPNPAGWFLGLAGIVLTVCLLIGSLILPVEQRPRNTVLLLAFLAVYVGYMGAVSLADRVLYLYHYFLPLLMSFLLFGVAMQEITRFGPWRISQYGKTIILFCCAIFVFLGFQFMRPFSYYEPILDEGVERRELLRLWDLQCVRCDSDDPLIRHTCED